MAIDPKLIDKLLADYKKPEDIIGEHGLLKQLTKAVLERAMRAEMSEHLGYEKHDQAGHHSGNSRNGKTIKALKRRFRRGAAGDTAGSQRNMRAEDRGQRPDPLHGFRRQDRIDVRAGPLAQVQLCIVHQVRASLNYVSWKQRKAVAGDLQMIYRASNAEDASSKAIEPPCPRQVAS